MNSLGNRLQLELFTAKEYGSLIRRQPDKFIKYTIRDYLLWITRLAPALRPAYLTCRIIDDVADGERELPREFDDFPQLIQIAQEQIKSGIVRTRSPLMLLLQQAVQSTSKRQIRDGETQEAYSGTLDAMLSEYLRRIERRLLTQDELVALHTASSYHPHNIGLICLGSRDRASNTPELSELIGRMDALRDMPKDLHLGIVNVPQEVVTQTDASYDSLTEDPSTVYSHKAVIDWMHSELDAGSALIEQLVKYKVDWTANLILRSRLKRRIPFVREKFPRFLNEKSHPHPKNGTVI